MSFPDNNWLTFNIFATSDIKTSSIFGIDEVFSFEFEDLEPPRVGAPDLHVSSSSCALDVPRLVVQLGSDGLGFDIEPPDLSVSSIWCLDDNISIVDEIKISIGLHLRDNVEWSFNVKAKIWVEISFLVDLGKLILIDNYPLLV